ncbi:MAG TPA: sugar kinase [Bacillales bacterium]|nr:sugar kinase [Bacillales bacterium]
MNVVTMGETMVLLSAESTGFMRYADRFTAKVAGAESNVAIGLARLGHRTGWISKLGNDEFGKKILTFIRGEGVDVSEVTFDPDAATGLYFKEQISEEEMRVQYYRAGSAASRLTPDDVNESYVAQADFLHLSGITPALSASCYETMLHAIRAAKQHGVKVVFDPNLRRKLWSEEEARNALLDLSGRADIVLPGLDEGDFLFGSREPETLARRFHELGAATVVVKLGEQGAYYSADQESGTVDAFKVPRVVDPVGAGDGFAAGLLSGLLDQLPLAKAVRRGAAVGAIVTMVHGDVEGLPDKERLVSFMSSENGEDVKR